MSTITGTVLRGDDAAPAGNVIFTPLSAPVVDGSVLVCGDPIPVTPANDGTFTVTLRPGTYSVRLPGVKAAIQIGVPDDAATYALTALITTELPVTSASPAITSARWSDERLIEHTLSGAYLAVDASDLDHLGGTAAVLWPDGSTGTFTITAWSSDFDMATAYTITHSGSGKTVTQPEITLNEDGLPTNYPTPTVA